MNSGQLVLVTLQNPREKFWGMLLALTPAGASLRGVDLQSFDDFMQMVKAGEATAANTVFFPMHRVQRMEVDARNGGRRPIVNGSCRIAFTGGSVCGEDRI